MIGWLKKWWKYLLAGLGLIFGAVFAIGGQAGGWVSDVKNRRAMRRAEEERKRTAALLAEQAKELAIAKLRKDVETVNKEAKDAARSAADSIDRSTRRRG